MSKLTKLSLCKLNILLEDSIDTGFTIDIDEQNLPVMLIGYSDYPTHGPTHRPLNPERLATVFKNVQSYFPGNAFETEKSMLDAYLIKSPCMIYLKKDGLPMF